MRPRTFARRQLGLTDDEFTFLAAGNIRPEKGFRDLLESAALLRKTCPARAFRVLIAGGPSDKSCYDELLLQQERLGLQSTVQFLGFCPDMQRLYAASDGFVLSSRSEGLPLVVLECMMAGVGIVATRVGAVPEVLNDGAGIIVSRESPEELAGAMRRLMYDTDLRQQMTANSKGNRDTTILRPCHVRPVPERLPARDCRGARRLILEAIAGWFGRLGTSIR